MSTSSFQDSQKRTWKLRFNLGNCRQLKDTVDFDFNELQTGEAVDLVHGDNAKFAALLWILCEKQCDLKNVNEDDFMGSIDENARDQLLGSGDEPGALEEAIVNFTSAHQRDGVKELLDAHRKMRKEAMSVMREVVSQNQDKMIAEGRREAQEAMNSLMGELGNEGSTSGSQSPN